MSKANPRNIAIKKRAPAAAGVRGVPATPAGARIVVPLLPGARFAHPRLISLRPAGAEYVIVFSTSNCTRVQLVRSASHQRCEQNAKSSSFAVMTGTAMTPWHGRLTRERPLRAIRLLYKMLIHIVGAPAVPHRWPWTLTCTCSWTSSASLFCCAIVLLSVSSW